MPFPYAYYKEFFDGPMHGWSFKGKALYLEQNSSNLKTDSGDVDVSGQSVLWFDTTAGDITIQGFKNSVAGQLLIVFKATTANKLTITNNGSGTHKAFLANGQNFVLGNGQVGGVIFQCVNVGGILKWIQIDSNGLYGNGTAASPAIAFASDPDTGIFKEAADTLSMSTSGVKRVHLNTSELYSTLSIRTAGQFQGTATSALWADLAERYLADKPYSPGTIVKIGGHAEITQTVNELDSEVFGVISTNPAFKMNDALGVNIQMNPFVALTGRVPCKVIGKIKKGDRIVSSDVEGHGRAATAEELRCLNNLCIVGRALEGKDDYANGKIEVVVGRF